MLKHLLLTLLYIIIIGLIISLIFITFAYGLFNGEKSFYLITLFFLWDYYGISCLIFMI